MRVLVVGSGAREHSLCRRLAHAHEVHAAPGNAGIAQDVFATHPVAADDVAGLTALARQIGAGLVVPGPEAPLVAGLVDRLRGEGLACFGPSASAARLEASKGFSKDFMARHDIPTAVYARFRAYDDAAEYVRRARHRVVVKADGLAAGKGVAVCDDVPQALGALDRALRGGAFGDAGREVVVEERLEGQEVSLHVLCDGESHAVLGVAQDHKRLGDGDTGPNTGGMGAYSPVPLWSDDLEARVTREVVTPTLRGMAAAGAPFRGVLFVGLMVSAAGDPRVLEYNVRFGDPECAVLLSRVDGDIAPWLYGCANGSLSERPVLRADRASVGVVIAAEGYPEAPKRGAEIRGVEAAAAIEGVEVLHAGTRVQDGCLVSAGGRVLLVTATASSISDARTRAYAAVDRIEMAGAQVRRDIGWRALGSG